MGNQVGAWGCIGKLEPARGLAEWNAVGSRGKDKV